MGIFAFSKNFRGSTLNPTELGSQLQRTPYLLSTQPALLELFPATAKLNIDVSNDVNR